MHFYKPQRNAQVNFPLLGHLYHESFILMKYKCDFKSTVLPRSINTSELQTLVLFWFSFICKNLKVLSSLCMKALKHVSASTCLVIRVVYLQYTSGIWKQSFFPTAQKFFIFQIPRFSFSICQFYKFLIFFYTTVKTEEKLLGKGILPHTLLAFYFLVADILHQVGSCTSKNLILCPTPQQVQISTSVFVSRYSVEISVTARTLIVAITTCDIHILGSKPKLYLNKNKLFHSGNLRQYLPLTLQTQ